MNRPGMNVNKPAMTNIARKIGADVGEDFFNTIPQEPTFDGSPGMTEKCQGTKSLRSSPLRGSKSREASSQLRG